MANKHEAESGAAVAGAATCSALLAILREAKPLLKHYENQLAASLSCDSRSHDDDREPRRLLNAIPEAIEPATADLEKQMADYKRATKVLDDIASDWEHMKRKEMVERAGNVLCEIGLWRKVKRGEFARHGVSYGVPN